MVSDLAWRVSLLSKQHHSTGRTEARVGNQAQREVQSRNIESEEIDQRVLITISMSAP